MHGPSISNNFRIFAVDMKPGTRLRHIKGQIFEIDAVWVQKNASVGVDIVNVDTGTLKYLPYVKLVRFLESKELEVIQ